MTNFIINEAKQMLRFQKTVILLILKAIAYTLRYGLSFLPWIVFFVFVARPMISGWRKAVTADEPPQPVMYSPQTFQAKPKQEPVWDDLQRKIDSGIRTAERMSRKIRKT